MNGRRLAVAAVLGGSLICSPSHSGLLECAPLRASGLGPEVYWPHAPGSSWTYDRVVVSWAAAARRVTSAVLFEIGARTQLPGGILVQPLTVEPGSGSGLAIHGPGLLHVGGDEVSVWREDGSRRSWLYLDADLDPGHAFSLQLADSVSVHATVLGPIDVSTPAGSFENALRVRYAIDWGWADVLDDQGGVLGRARAGTRGEIFYARDVGPVLARETFVPQLETQGAPPPPAADSTFTELRLQSYALLPEPVAPVSWSAVKRRFR